MKDERDIYHYISGLCPEDKHKKWFQLCSTRGLHFIPQELMITLRSKRKGVYKLRLQNYTSNAKVSLDRNRTDPVDASKLLHYHRSDTDLITIIRAMLRKETQEEESFTIAGQTSPGVWLLGDFVEFHCSPVGKLKGSFFLEKSRTHQILNENNEKNTMISAASSEISASFPQSRCNAT